MTRSKSRNRDRAEPGHDLARLWAPWRAAYVKGANGPRARGCIFCFGRIGAAAMRRRLVLHAGPDAVVMLNRYPYNNGHLMIAPRRHIASPELLERSERSAIGELVAAAVVRIREAMRPEGINLGANLGRVAGAGFADHMHWHLVPRWAGDTNFMAAVAGTRVLSESLEESYDLLKPLFNDIAAAITC